MRKLICILFLLCANIGFALQAPAIQEAIDQFRIENKIPSVVLTISYPDQSIPTEYMSGSIATDNNQPVTAGNLFQVGSITKSFIAMMILTLQHNGQLSLDDPLSLYFPEYPNWGNVTIRQLLNHTSGIYNYTDSAVLRSNLLIHPYDYIESDTLLNYAKNEPLYFKPGAGWHYSNTNYILLGEIIERVSFQPIEKIFADKLNQLHLENTFFVKHLYDAALNERILHGYYQLNPATTFDITHYSMSWLNTAGGLVSNGDDLTAWIRALLTGKVLNQTELNEMQQLVSITDGQPIHHLDSTTPEGYGLGIRAYQTAWKNIDVIWWHSGGTVGYKSLMMWLPKQNIAIAMAYTEVAAGQEAIAFDPTTPLAQKILSLISNPNHV